MYVDYMTEEKTYIPQAGHRIKRPDWVVAEFDVIHIDGTVMFGYIHTDDGPQPDWFDIDAGPWVEVEKPRLLPETWITVDRQDDEVLAFQDANRAAFEFDDFDLYRVWSEADGTPRIERVTA